MKKKISSREPLHSGKRHQLRRRFEARTVASFDTYSQSPSVPWNAPEASTRLVGQQALNTLNMRVQKKTGQANQAGLCCMRSNPWAIK